MGGGAPGDTRSRSEGPALNYGDFTGLALNPNAGEWFGVDRYVGIPYDVGAVVSGCYIFCTTMAKMAVIKTGGKQYLVHEGSVLRVEKLPPADGSVMFDEVLLVADAEEGKVEVGTPKLATTVTAKVVRQGRAKKIRVVHYKAKVRYHKVYGHRQPFTEVRIEKIS